MGRKTGRPNERPRWPGPRPGHAKPATATTTCPMIRGPLSVSTPAMSRFVHERHKPAAALERPRELVVACAALRSNINLSRIVRVASCSGIDRVIGCGNAKVIGKIARDGADAIQIDVHRTLAPVLEELKQQGYRLVGLEQATGSVNLHHYAFQRRSGAGYRKRTVGIDRRPVGAGRGRRRNSCLGAAL